ncbi:MULTISPECIES: D-psicose 3-epimerase [Bacillus]|uniref:Xylose isomerase-like TIM barrel domain-containing protein n=2 Tax=Bacillus TaxID=1386 RepID=A0A0M4FWC6_9BACI|nr:MULTISPECIES: sugar phosphate isomerase/epimerase family protein [Bacillus]ALC83068.1 hypothetical protein AM592_16925 [Bacillus gobiensis]MBP1082112.1 D-psicose/D-tagatose/L-ribulose 3-epimerase [Bacillus capparidis]MED1096735.1 sugar phosphate isomerase/epimerase [Bacillus capparidis]
MKYGIHFGYWTQEWDTDIKPLIPKAANLGFDVLEVGPFPGLMEQDQQEMNEVKRIAADHNIELTYCLGLSPDLDLTSPDDTTRIKGIRYIQQLIESVYQMGGSQLSGILYSDWPAMYKEVKTMDDKKNALVRAEESLEVVLETAVFYGIHCSLELVNRFEQWLMNSVDEGVAFQESLNHSNCSLLLDTFHMNIEEDDIPAAIRRAGQNIGHFHVCENNRKVPRPGSRLDWPSILQALKDIDYSGRIVFEPFVKPEGTIGKDIRIWRDLSGQANEEQIDQQLKEGLHYLKSTFSH